MDDDPGDRPSDEMRGRVPGSRAKLWVLLGADRWAVTGVLLAGIFGVLVVFGRLDPAPLRGAVAASDPIETLFQGLLTAIVTAVTLVVTINQLVLSQELGSLGDQRDRMRGAMSFREDTEGVVDEPVSPAEPSAFLLALIDAARSRAERLADAVARCGDAQLRRQIEEFADGVVDNAESVGDQLERAEFGTFEVVLAALNFNYSRKIYRARRFRTERGDALSADADEALAELVTVLELFAPAREHVKTLYFQWELINLSRAMLYAAVPALVVAVSTILYLDDVGTVTGITLGVDNLVWVVSAAVAVVLVPFLVLLSYVLRIATVAKRTLAIGPLILRSTDGTDGTDGTDRGQ
jgi:hypothetical protein